MDESGNRILDFRFQISDFKFQISDWESTSRAFPLYKRKERASGGKLALFRRRGTVRSVDQAAFRCSPMEPAMIRLIFDPGPPRGG